MGCSPSKYQIHAETALPPQSPGAHVKIDTTLPIVTATATTSRHSPSHHSINHPITGSLMHDHAHITASLSLSPPASHSSVTPRAPGASTIASTLAMSENRSTALLVIARALAAETRLTGIIQIIVNQVPELMDCDRCTLFFIDRDNSELIVRREASSGRKKTLVSWVFGQSVAPELPFIDGETELRLPMKGLAGAVATSGHSLRIEDAHLDSRFDPSMDKETGYRTRSMLCVPMIDSHGECIGVVQAINKNPVYEQGFDSADEALLLTFAAQAALAVRNSQLLSKTSAALTQSDALLEITNVLASELKMDQLLSIICNKAQSLLGCQRCTVFLVGNDRKELYTSSSMSFGMGPSAVVSGEKDNEKLLSFPINRGIAGHVATTGEVINLPDVYLDSRFDRTVDKDTGFRTKSLLCLPIKNHRNEIVGVIQVMNKQRRFASVLDSDYDGSHPVIGSNICAVNDSSSPKHRSIGTLMSTSLHSSVVPFSAANVRLLTAFSSQAAVAIENSRLFTQTERALNQALAEQRNLRFMLSVTKNLFSDLHLQSILQTLIKQVHHIMKADHCVFYLVDQQTHCYWLAKEDGQFTNVGTNPHSHTNTDELSSSTDSSTSTTLSNKYDCSVGFAGEVIRTGQSLRLNAQAFQHGSFSPVIDQRGMNVPQSVLYCPIVGNLNHTGQPANSSEPSPSNTGASQSSVVGVIGVWDVLNRGGFESGEEELLQAFCAQASVAISSSAHVSAILLGSEIKENDDSAAAYLKDARGMKLADHKIDHFQYKGEDLVIKGLIGVGSYGEVYRAQMAEDSDLIVAVKKFHIRQLQAEQVDAFCMEASLMCQLQHLNVVAFIGAITEPTNLAIITEFCGKGSLADLLIDQSVELTFLHRLRFALDAARGMHYLHTSNPVILHRDLKSDNLLVTSDNVIKVADFGLTRFLSEGKQMTQVGTPMWMAPEIIQGTQYTQKADVYAFGIILWEILTRLEPYEDKEPMQIVLEVVNDGARPELPIELEESPLVPLMRQCWAQCPTERPSFHQCVQQLQSIVDSIDPTDHTPHGIPNTYNITLRVPDKSSFPSLSALKTRRLIELKAAQSAAEAEQQKEYEERQRQRAQQLQQDDETDDDEDEQS